MSDDTNIETLFAEWLKADQERTANATQRQEMLRRLVDAASDSTPDDPAQPFRKALRELPAEATAGDIRVALQTAAKNHEASIPDTPPRAIEIGQIDDKLPPALFSLPGDKDKGAVLPVGEAALLAGEGGTGKSTLASDLALAVAHSGRKDSPFDVHKHGPTLWLAYEEAPALIAARARARGSSTGIHVLDLRGGKWPLFGPKGSYNSRPEPLAGWQAMTDAAASITPRLIVIDPALSAYAGEPNAAPPVREFMERLSAFARSIDDGCSILVLAHATKERNAGPFDRAQAGGSGAWTDAARCCLTLTHGGGDGERDNKRTLGVLKANAGPSHTWTALEPVRKQGGNWIIGFKGRDWKPANEHVKVSDTPKSEKTGDGGKPTTGKAYKVKDDSQTASSFDPKVQAMIEANTRDE